MVFFGTLASAMASQPSSMYLLSDDTEESAELASRMNENGLAFTEVYVPGVDPDRPALVVDVNSRLYRYSSRGAFVNELVTQVAERV